MADGLATLDLEKPANSVILSPMLSTTEVMLIGTGPARAAFVMHLGKSGMPIRALELQLLVTSATSCPGTDGLLQRVTSMRDSSHMQALVATSLMRKLKPSEGITNGSGSMLSGREEVLMESRKSPKRT